MSTTQHKLTLPAAVFININVILGAGLFMNTANVAKWCGAIGFVNYALIGLLMLPLVISITTLLSLHPEGSFYGYGQKEIGTFAGFITAWAYFTGKLGSTTILTHTAVLILQELFPALAVFHPFILDISILTLFIALNTLNLRIGSTIQLIFTFFKAMPILFVILAGIFLFSWSNVTPDQMIWSGIPSALPLVFYAIMGFEAVCSLSSRIENAQRNAPLAILISYGITLTVIILYQFFFYGVLGQSLAQESSYRESLPALANVAFSSTPWLAAALGGLFNLGIAISALGGVYGVLFSNNWNLYTLAQHDHLFCSDFFKKLNKHHIPVACVLAEGFVCLLYLLVSGGNQIVLQQLSVLGVVLTYTLSVLALIVAKVRRPELNISLLVPILGLCSCALLIGTSIRGLILKGPAALYCFGALLFLGSIMYLFTKRRTQSQII